MGEHYSQIDFAERRRIQDMRDAKMLVTAIAEALDHHRSTSYRLEHGRCRRRRWCTR